MSLLQNYLRVQLLRPLGKKLCCSKVWIHHWQWSIWGLRDADSIAIRQTFWALVVLRITARLIYYVDMRSTTQLCFLGEYMDSQGHCQRCEASCALCRGPGPEDCTKCPMSKWVTSFSNLGDSRYAEPCEKQFDQRLWLSAVIRTNSSHRPRSTFVKSYPHELSFIGR